MDVAVKAGRVPALGRKPVDAALRGGGGRSSALGSKTVDVAVKAGRVPALGRKPVDAAGGRGGRPASEGRGRYDRWARTLGNKVVDAIAGTLRRAVLAVFTSEVITFSTVKSFQE